MCVCVCVLVIIKNKQELKPSMEFRCANECGKSGTKFKKCGACRVVHYCSVDCSAAHWKRAHKADCSKMLEDPLLSSKLKLRRRLRSAVNARPQMVFTRGSLYDFTDLSDFKFTEFRDVVAMDRCVITYTECGLFVQSTLAIDPRSP